ncbi:MAG: hypothetical protein QOI11_260 [Candidatus Eremiobacteraeota bacterium]|nr:hypothetical protein [Candidatus Eremiobacteraeota bacterium]
MTSIDNSVEDRLEPLVARLSARSIADRFNPYEYFRWPESLPEDAFWMNRELLTVHGTQAETELSEADLMRLSRWESLHFYSLNIHGIRELIAEVVNRIHTPGHEKVSPFFHHFLGEENEHMWYFAEFCRRYGKIYPDRSLKTSAITDPLVANVLAFARIQIFEEIVDYFNVALGKNEALHPFIREINTIHHRDESRHIAFGRNIVSVLYEELRAKGSAEAVREVEDYVARYVAVSIQSLYDPQVYRDAELPLNAYALRRSLLADPARKAVHAKILQRPVSFLLKQGILSKQVDV